MAEHWIYGLHAVEAILKNPKRDVLQLFVSDNRQDARIKAIIALAVERQVVAANINKIPASVAHQSHQGVVAKVKPLDDFQEGDIPWLLQQCQDFPLILVLDGITDVHNLGACIRSADGAGVDMIIVPKDKSAPINEVVSKVACGAAECVPMVRVTNLARSLQKLKDAGVWVYGAAGEATQPLYTLDGKRPIAVVMGSEGKGLRRLTRERCDSLFSLPMRGTVESLNVSVATGISLFEINRQREGGSS